MDLRIERTRKSIINAFIKLRTHKPIEKITIKELADLAFINKATFYSHYHDIYDLSEQLENEIIDSIIKGIPHSGYIITNPRQATQELSLAMAARTELLNTIFSENRKPILVKKLEHGLKEQIYAQYPEYKQSLTWDITLSTLIHGCFHAYLSHADSDINEVIAILGDISECLSNRFLAQKN